MRHVVEVVLGRLVQAYGVMISILMRGRLESVKKGLCAVGVICVVNSCYAIAGVRVGV
jgi:hypothetical protein